MSDIIGALNLFVASVYAYLTFRIVKASREQIESVTRPYITVTHRLSNDGLIILYIKNTGKTNAKNLKLEIDKNFYHLNNKREEYNLAKIYAFTNVIESFPPESVLEFPLSASIYLQSKNSVNNLNETIFEIKAIYSYSTKKITETTKIDLNTYSGIWMPQPTMEDRLKEIKEELKEFRSLVEKINVTKKKGFKK